MVFAKDSLNASAATLSKMKNLYNLNVQVMIFNSCSTLIKKNL
jgi:hypothetical protein